MTLSNELKQYLKIKNVDVNKTEQQQGEEIQAVVVQVKNEEPTDETLKSDNALKSFLTYVSLFFFLLELLIYMIF